MPLRSVVFWIHLACGLVAGAVILLMSVTGVLLTYQKQMTEWSDRQYWTAPSLGEGVRAPLSDIVASARAHDPEASVGSVTLYADPEAPAAASLGRGRTLYLDPSTAEVRGENTSGMRDFFSLVVGWHRWLGVSGEGRSTARAVTGWSNVVFLFLVLSGLYLWFPRRWRWQHIRPILFLKPRAHGKARDFNWHHVFGFWTALPLALVIGSATVISFPWASDLAYRAAGDEPPVRRTRASAAPRPAPAPASESAEESREPEPFDLTSLDRVAGPAMERLENWRTITFSIPDEAGPDIRVGVDQGWGGAPQKRHTLTYASDTGRELAYAGFEGQSPGRRFRSYLRFAHTGEFYGLFGQTIAGLASFAGVLLVWSGFALAWRRLVGPLLRRSGVDASA